MRRRVKAHSRAWASSAVSSSGPAADAARAEFREILARKGHAVDNARDAAAQLEAAFAASVLSPSAFVDQALKDLDVAIEQDEGQRLGGKSAEASRFILRAIDRSLDEL